MGLKRKSSNGRIITVGGRLKKCGCCGLDCECKDPCSPATGYTYFITKEPNEDPVAQIAAGTSSFCCLDDATYEISEHDLFYKTDPGGGALGCLVRDDLLSYSGGEAPFGFNYTRRRIRRDATTCALTSDTTDHPAGGFLSCEPGGDFYNDPYDPPHAWVRTLESSGGLVNWGMIWGTATDHVEDTWGLSSLTGVGQVWHHRIVRYSRRTSTCYPTGCMTGACCKQDGTCTMLDPDTCIAAGGRHFGPGVSCADGPCSAGEGGGEEFL